MSLLSSSDTFLHPFEDDESNSKTTKLSPMGEDERYEIETKFKGLTEKIKHQRDLLDKRECASKEEVTKLKA